MGSVALALSLRALIGRPLELALSLHYLGGGVPQERGTVVGVVRALPCLIGAELRLLRSFCCVVALDAGQRNA